MASLSLRHIYKIYQGNVQAVSDFNLEIEDKEFIVFVGPSGCGKSTTLRMVAGLEEISAGELYIDGRLVNDVEPKDRDIAMVFQNYALYPHMTVYDNMAFGLKLRKIPHAEIDARVKEAAAILGIDKYLTRKPKALSGGQRQRVALGRAIVREPKVFLLDEPLSNLDAKLRVQMRTEITKLHNKLATTFIYVTHDQTEAMTMGTRIVVMKDGIVQQVDTPQNLYDYPCNQFVATFIGTPQMNLIRARLEKEGKKLVVKFGNSSIELPESKSKKLIDDSYIGKEVIFGVRPEDLHDEEIFVNASPKTCIDVYVDVMEKLGSETMLYTNIEGKDDYCIARVDARTSAKVGDTVRLAVDANHVHLFDAETELAILTVPMYNYYEADIKADANNVVATIAGTDITIPSVVDKLTKPALIGAKALVGVNPQKVSLDGEGSMSMQGIVDFVEDTNAYKVIYAQVAGKSALSPVKAPLDAEYKKGDKITFSFDDEAVMIFDPETGDRVVSYGAVPAHNICPSQIEKIVGKDGQETVAVTFGTTKFKLPASKKITSEATAATVAIAPDAFVYSKEQMAGKPSIKIKIDAVDKISDYTLVYGATDAGLKIVAKLDAAFKGIANDKVKLAWDPFNVDLLVNNGTQSILETVEAPVAEEPVVEEPAEEEKKDEE